MHTESLQANAPRADVVMSAIERRTNMTTMTVQNPGDRRRTIVALVSASIISLMVWGLVVALNVP
ncbi:MAG TPA: hypothetical protein VGK52_08000 [Polyangia bacterium]|jgi:hypothetical protein